MINVIFLKSFFKQWNHRTSQNHLDRVSLSKAKRKALSFVKPRYSRFLGLDIGIKLKSTQQLVLLLNCNLAFNYVKGKGITAYL